MINRFLLPFAIIVVFITGMVTIGLRPAPRQITTPQQTSMPQSNSLQQPDPSVTFRGANNLRFEAQLAMSHGLRWNGIVGYNIEYELQSRYWINTTEGWTSWESLRESGRVGYAHTKLTLGRKYQYRVRALDSNDRQIGDFSNRLTRTMPLYTPTLGQ